jgi:glycolate oxidase
MPEAPHLTELTGDYQCLHRIHPRGPGETRCNIWGYLIATSETTLRRNRAARCHRTASVLRDVSKVDPTTNFLGMKLRLPVMLAPGGSLNRFIPGGAATAGRAASNLAI